MKMTFESWCAKNYYKIRERLSLQGLFDEDAYQDAYLSIINRVRKGEQILCYYEQIINAYRRYCKKHSTEGFIYIRPDELFFAILSDDEITPIETKAERPSTRQLMREIRLFVKHNYTKCQITEWELRSLSLLSYTDIAAFTNRPYNKVRDNVCRINKNIKQKYEKSYYRRMTL